MMAKLSSDIRQNVLDIKRNIEKSAILSGRTPDNISLMAVTKTVPADIVNLAINNGINLIGESKAQELLRKIDSYDKNNLEIHFIGQLQSNKVRQIIEYVSMIQSVDRISLVKEVNKRAAAIGKTMDILIQVNIGRERSKAGVMPEDVINFAKNLENYQNIRLRGIMSIPPICKEKQQLIEHFNNLRQYLVDIQREKVDNESVNVLSIGMSGDYETAIECGATIVRIGSALFGERAV